MMKPILQWALPVFLIAYIGVLWVGQKWYMKKKYGLVVEDLPADELSELIASYLINLMILPIYAVVMYAVVTYSYRLTAPMTFVEMIPLQIAGLVLLIVAFGIMLMAQIQMGEAWRDRIDLKSETKLVKSGLFRFSRNPIFLGMLLAMLGLWLCIPNAFTLLTLGGSYMLIQIQVRLEEKHLLKLHGEEYVSYQQTVTRWGW